MSRPAALVLIGTPIGNLGDLSPRAIEELASASVICCEDTRRTGKLLAHAGIERPDLLVVNDHNESSRRAEVVRRIEHGERVAVVTDAGMPGISDPGERLVSAVVRAGLTVEVVPGPSAGVAALVGSGLPTGRYVFEGFLPRKAGARAERLAELVDERRTLVFYEAPHRVDRTLADLAAAFGGDRRVVVARELTKLYEEFWRGSLDEAVAWAADTPPRGEIAIVVDGAPAPAEPTDDDVSAELRRLLDGGLSTRDAAADVAGRFGLAKKRVYNLALELGR
ncbi:MAG: 16S rRNA (cytidine(1402)-2'-O)-methyltransferase [Actinomycetota bacterium]